MNQANIIQTLFGSEGIKTVYQQTLQAKSIDIVCLSDNYDQILEGYFETDFLPKLHQSDIQVREILANKSSNKTSTTTKLMPSNRNSQSDYIITDKHLILISFNPKNPFAIIISDPDIHANVKNQFDHLWKSL